MFEVDHPATQAWKRELLEKTRITVPGDVTYVPVDFTRSNSAASCAEPDFAATRRRSSRGWASPCTSTARKCCPCSIGSPDHLPPGSGIAFDYAIDPAKLNLFEKLVFWLMARRVAAVGEPWRATFKPGELVRAMTELGYADVRELRARDINERYFANRTDRLKVGTLAGMITARR